MDIETHPGIDYHLLELLVVYLHSQPHLDLLDLTLTSLQRVVHPSTHQYVLLEFAVRQWLTQVCPETV